MEQKDGPSLRKEAASRLIADADPQSGSGFLTASTNSLTPIVNAADAFVPPNAVVAAGLPRRVAAQVIDHLLLGLVYNLPVLLIVYAWTFSKRVIAIPGAALPFGQDQPLLAMVGVMLIAGIAALLSVAGPCLYFSFFESSHRQATPGKRLLRLKVMSTNADRMPFLQCVRKWCLQWVVFLAGFFGLGLVGLSGFQLPFACLYFLVGYGPVWFNRGRQTLFDKMAGRFVVCDQAPRAVLPITDAHRKGGNVTRIELAFASALFLTAVLWMSLAWFHIDQDSVARELMTSVDQPNKTGRAVVAARELLPGEVIKPEDLRVESWGQWRTPATAVSDSAAVQGGRVLFAMSAGSPLYAEPYGNFASRHCRIATIIEERALSDIELGQMEARRTVSTMVRGNKYAKKMDGWYSNNAHIDIQKGEYQAAIIECNRGLRSKDLTNEGKADVLTMKALAHLRMRKLSEALADCQESLKLDPNNTVALATSATIHRIEGNVAAARNDEAEFLSLRRSATEE